MSKINRQITLAAMPVGAPRESDFKRVESPVPVPDQVVSNIDLACEQY
jgi:hypothetical protein